MNSKMLDLPAKTGATQEASSFYETLLLRLLKQTDEDLTLRAKVSDASEADNVEDGSTFKTRYMNGNPHFVTKIRENRKGSLYVPTEKMNVNGRKFHRFVNLRDPYGHSWHSKVSPWKDGRLWLQGWNQLRNGNHVCAGDVCLCEIVRGRGRVGTYIQAHIRKA